MGYIFAEIGSTSHKRLAFGRFALRRVENVRLRFISYAPKRKSADKINIRHAKIIQQM